MLRIFLAKPLDMAPPVGSMTTMLNTIPPTDQELIAALYMHSLADPIADIWF